MPNGGSDCCGTCWFNRTNEGEAGYGKGGDGSKEPYCEIRNQAIEDPFYTYCANHPHRRPDRDRIPIGPILRFADDYSTNERKVWIKSPDTGEIRQHLLELLDEFFTMVSEDRYPIGPGIGEVVIRQLGEFREERALDRLRWIGKEVPGRWGESAREAVGRIEEG